MRDLTIYEYFLIHKMTIHCIIRLVLRHFEEDNSNCVEHICSAEKGMFFK
jgi:hypothetical protein